MAKSRLVFWFFQSFMLSDLLGCGDSARNKSIPGCRAGGWGYGMLRSRWPRAAHCRARQPTAAQDRFGATPTGNDRVAWKTTAAVTSACVNSLTTPSPSGCLLVPNRSLDCIPWCGLKAMLVNSRSEIQVSGDDGRIGWCLNLLTLVRNHSPFWMPALSRFPGQSPAQLAI